MKMFKSIIGVVATLGIMLSMGCVEKFEADVDNMPMEGLVVEGNIISDSTVVFCLSKTLPLYATEDKEDLFEDFMNVDAVLSVKGGDGTSWPGIPLGNGRYQVAIGVLQPDVEYQLEIQYNGDTYLSAPQKPLETIGIEDVTFRQPDLSGPVSILLNTRKGNTDEAQYYLWYFEEDWEVRAHFATTNLFIPELDKIVSYDYPPVAQGWCHSSTTQIMLGTTASNVENRIVGKVLRTIENTDHRLSLLYSIRVQQRNLTRQEYEYYQVRSKLSNEMGGLFTPQPSELPTNVVCSDPSRKVIGYVGCNMGIDRYQLYISEEDVVYIDTYRCDMGKDPDGSYMYKYSEGFQVSDVTPVSIEWARIGCVDVREKRADPLGRPSWWPNPYLYYKESLDVGNN